jgi:hypothetical protein
MIRRMASAVLCRALSHFKSMLISFKLFGFAIESDAKRNFLLCKFLSLYCHLQLELTAAGQRCGWLNGYD